MINKKIKIFIISGCLTIITNICYSFSWKFVVYGDTRTNDNYHREVLQSIINNTPDFKFIINTGDVVADGRILTNWEIWQSACNDILGGTGQNQTPPLYLVCPGNHEELISSEGLANWKKYLYGQVQQFGNDGRYFVLDYKNSRFIFLDSNISTLSEPQYSMFIDAVSNNNKTWLFTVWHHPIFDFSERIKKYEDAIHDNWGVAMYQNGGDIMFTGHAHFYVRTKKLQLNGNKNPPIDPENGTVQIVAGTGGAPLISVSPDNDGNGYMVESYISDYGYCEVEVNDNSLHLTFYLRDGSIFDKTTYTANKKKHFPPESVSDFISYRSGDSLSLTWSAVTTDTCGNPIEIDHYTIHKSIDVRFDPLTTETIGPIRETSYTDNSPGVVGDPSVNYFYRIVAVKENGQTSKPSNITGEFDYNLITTPSTDFNEIALPIMPKNISTADDLMNFIPGCNSVARWNAQIQGYEQYIPELSFTNFDVKPGYPYYVNVTQNVVVTLTGEVKTPSFDLVTTPTTDFNEIMLTLDKANILTASSLMSDIPGCNSVARWNAQIQGYEQYIPELPFTNFNVKPGYPYYVNVTQNATWPDGDGSQKRVLGSTVLSATSKTPHLVWGRVRTDVDIGGFTSYINSHDSDILSHVSPGCFLRDGYWAVQCGNFNSHWIPGDVLTVEFENKEGIRISTAKITLSDMGYDKVIDIIPNE